MPNLDKRKEQEVFDPIELRDMLVEKGMVGSLVKNLSREEMMAILDAFTDMKQAKAKGGNIEKQMELFQDGGLKDEGGTKDPISGNDVPPGATQEEVRDDIPAQLSEGEFVFPADVVRYIGLEKLMRMRQEAKMGLKMMEDMGQMGNADEATIPDDIPFSVIDIQIAEGDDDDDEVEKRAEGGVIEAANGFAGTTTATNPLQTRQSSMTASPTGLKTAYTAPTIPTATAAPTGGFQYKSPTDPTQKATFKGLFGGDELTQGPDEYKTYVNDAGAEIQIPFKNGKLLTGFTIPEGFKLKTEKVDTAKIQTAKVKSTVGDTGDGGDPNDNVSSASLAFGGRSDGKGGQIGGITSNVSYNISPMGGAFGVFSSLGTINDINKGKDVTTIGNNFGLTTNPVTLSYGAGKSISLTSQDYSKVKNNVVGQPALDLANRQINLDALGRGVVSFNATTGVYTDDKGREISVDDISQAGKDIADHISQQVSLGGKTTEQVVATLNNNEIDALMEHNSDREDKADQDRISRGIEAVEKATGKSFAQLQQESRDAVSKGQGASKSVGLADMGLGSINTDSDDGQASSTSAETGFGTDAMGDIGTAKGGFIKKPKPKPKKMKRGGLASR